MAEIKNVVASVHQRLLNLSRERGEDFTLTLTKYGLERLLYRLSISKHCETFVLKGALLFELWTKQRYRPTRDADFLAHGDSAPERFVAVFRELCAIQVPVDDGCQFNSGSVVAERIKGGMIIKAFALPSREISATRNCRFRSTSASAMR